MVSDQEIARGVETVLRQSDPNAVTSLNSVVQQLEAKLGLDLSHKAGFIKDQITYLLRSHPVPKDHLPLQSYLQFPNTFLSQQFLRPHFDVQQQPLQQGPQPQNNAPPPGTQVQQHLDPTMLPVAKGKLGAAQNAAANVAEAPKGSTPVGTKRRGGPGGLNKVCGISPELQTIVGGPALPRTEQLWAYIRKHNLQDPGNKRKIICDDPLRVVFETDCTDMFKMNKLLAKHIIPLDPTKSGQAKKSKVEDEPAKQTTNSRLPPEKISDALAKFFGTEDSKMVQSEALGRVWEYIKLNQLEDPLNTMVIHCDVKLQELLGCESISALGLQEMLTRNHLSKFVSSCSRLVIL
ncbi:uncharacterized protein [Primulina huaijiensis]|uniref:uncharacterized protein isoform X2 n=1 Tax=Primulina huaijiensis TaxID=1492673 RepID=UPI003CC780B2